MSGTLPVVRALLDANVLVPISLCDLLLRLADEGLYQPLWSAMILDEAERSLVRDIGLAAERARGRRDAMEAHFPDALVTEYLPLVPAMRNHPKDRHILAAAVRGRAALIVTRNLRHFPATALAPYPLRARLPDAFLHALFIQTPNTITRIVAEQAAGLRRTSPTVAQVMQNLELHAPIFVRTLREWMREHDLGDTDAS